MASCTLDFSVESKAVAEYSMQLLASVINIDPILEVLRCECSAEPAASKPYMHD